MVMLGRRAAAAPPSPLVIPEGGDKPKRITHVAGTGGMGKTLYAKAMLRARLNAGGRAVVIDPASQFGDYGTVVSVARAVAALENAGNRRFSLIVRGAWDEEVSAVFAAAFNAGALLLVVDEAQEIGGPLGMDKNFLRVTMKGRNKLVDLVTTSQTPTDLHPRIRAQYSSAVAFRLAMPDHAERFAVEYLKRPAWAPLLLKLPQFHYIRAEFDGRIERGVIRDPRVHGPP